MTYFEIPEIKCIPFSFVDPEGGFAVNPWTISAGISFATWAYHEIATSRVTGDAIQPTTSPIDFIAGAVGARMGGSLVNSTSTASNVAHELPSISTPYGKAVQTTDAQAVSLRNSIENAGGLYRQGNFGKQYTSDAQFWAGENPASVSGFNGKYGTASSSGPDWMMKGTLKESSEFITRSAPGVSGNAGGGTEAVVNPGSVKIDWFHTP